MNKHNQLLLSLFYIRGRFINYMLNNLKLRDMEYRNYK